MYEALLSQDLRSTASSGSISSLIGRYEHALGIVPAVQIAGEVRFLNSFLSRQSQGKAPLGIRNMFQAKTAKRASSGLVAHLTAAAVGVTSRGPERS